MTRTRRTAGRNNSDPGMYKVSDKTIIRPDFLATAKTKNMLTLYLSDKILSARSPVVAVNISYVKTNTSLQFTLPGVCTHEEADQ